MDIPSEFICPITQEIMKEPVSDNEGVSYEKLSIERWLSRNNTSPMSRRPLYMRDLRPNIALKNLISSFNDKNKVSTEVLINQRVFRNPTCNEFWFDTSDLPWSYSQEETEVLDELFEEETLRVIAEQKKEIASKRALDKAKELSDAKKELERLKEIRRLKDIQKGLKLLNK